MYVVAGLLHGKAAERGAVACGCRQACYVCVVLYVLHACAYAGAGFVDAYVQLHTCLELLVEVAVVPPVVLGVEVTVVERGAVVLGKGVGLHRGGLAPQVEFVCAAADKREGA